VKKLIFKIQTDISYILHVLIVLCSSISALVHYLYFNYTASLIFACFLFALTIYLTRILTIQVDRDTITINKGLLFQLIPLAKTEIKTSNINAIQYRVGKASIFTEHFYKLSVFINNDKMEFYSQFNTKDLDSLLNVIIESNPSIKIIK